VNIVVALDGSAVEVFREGFSMLTPFIIVAHESK
jgi:hypothetical protein